MPGNENARGFTLLEVVAALTLLGMGLAVLFAGYLQAANLESRAAEAGLAGTLARSVLARVEAGAETAGGGSCEGAAGYRWTLRRDPTAETGLTRLTVTVTWEAAPGRAASAWALVDRGP